MNDCKHTNVTSEQELGSSQPIIICLDCGEVVE